MLKRIKTARYLDTTYGPNLARGSLIFGPQLCAFNLIGWMKISILGLGHFWPVIKFELCTPALGRDISQMFCVFFLLSSHDWKEQMAICISLPIKMKTSSSARLKSIGRPQKTFPATGKFRIRGVDEWRHAYLIYSAHNLIGSWIIESAAYLLVMLRLSPSYHFISKLHPKNWFLKETERQKLKIFLTSLIIVC